MYNQKPGFWYNTNKAYEQQQLITKSGKNYAHWELSKRLGKKDESILKQFRFYAEEYVTSDSSLWYAKWC